MSTTNQDYFYLKWLSQTYHNKELANYNNTIHNTTQKNKQTSSTCNLSPATAASSRSNDSPVISTPLDPCVDEMLSPAFYSPHQTSPIIYHHSTNDISVGPYIDQGHHHTKTEPIFTGDPMELLIDKSKANNNSPYLENNATTSTIHSAATTPFQGTTSLFAPIESSSFSSSYDYQQQQQYISNPYNNNNDDVEHYHHYPHHHHHHIIFDHLSYDKQRCNNTTDFLQALEGLTNSPPTSSLSSHMINYENSQQKESSSSSSAEYYAHQHESQSAVANDNNNNMDTTSVTGSKRKRKSGTAGYNNSGSDSDSSQNDSNHNNQHRRITKNKKKTKKPEEKRFGCPICKRKFSRRYNLNTHIRTHNANRIKEFVCDHCGAAFDRKHDRGRHMDSVHYGNRSFSCDTCQATFCRRDALVRHCLKTHPES